MWDETLRITSCELYIFAATFLDYAWSQILVTKFEKFSNFYILIINEILCEKWLSGFSSNLYVLRLKFARDKNVPAKRADFFILNFSRDISSSKSEKNLQ